MTASAKIITDGTQRMFQITIPTLLSEGDQLERALSNVFRAAALAEYQAASVFLGASHQDCLNGYEIIKASAFEVGLTKNGKGVRTWWAKDFEGLLPSLDHPLIQEAIKINEELCQNQTTKS